jgi:TonB family protein
MPADEARRLQAAGPYRINILVSETGLPAQVVLAQSSGNDRMDAMALEAARTARFVPAQLDGVRVLAWYEVRFP